MKLNLVPATVRKGAAMRTMMFISALIVLLSGLATAFLIVTSTTRRQQAFEAAEAARPQANQAVATAKQTAAVLASSQGVATNLDLYSAAVEHNTKYTRFYKKVLPYIPAFMRVTSMSLDPISENSCRLNVTGVIRSAQQYADLSLAMLRIPGAKAISRSGFVYQWGNVPAITAEDQKALRVRAGEPVLPEDPVERLNALVSNAAAETTGFQDISNFGSATEFQRGAMTDWSLINIGVVLSQEAGEVLPPGWSFDFLTPNPSDTLAQASQFNSAGINAGGAQGTAPGATPGITPPAGAGAKGAGGALNPGNRPGAAAAEDL